MNPFGFHIPPADESSVAFLNPHDQQQPKERKRKRSKFPRPTTQFSLRQYNPDVGEISGTVETKPVKRPYRKKALLVAREAVAGGEMVHPCTECGKRFCSWKALFGHMRCHPERQWRGINPPTDRRHAISTPSPAIRPETTLSRVGMEEEEVARCLIMLSCSVVGGDGSGGGSNGGRQSLVPNEMLLSLSNDRPDPACNNASGTYQDPCGSKETRKNVKGCFVKHGDAEHDEMYAIDHHQQQVDHHVKMVHRHNCSVCMRMFSCGQALGGHMRYHHHLKQQQKDGRGSILDLNLPAPMDMEDLPDDTTGSLGLDLNLGSGSTEIRIT